MVQIAPVFGSVVLVFVFRIGVATVVIRRDILGKNNTVRFEIIDEWLSQGNQASFGGDLAQFGIPRVEGAVEDVGCGGGWKG